MDELKDSFQDLVKMQIKDINTLRDKALKAKVDLTIYQGACTTNKNNLAGDQAALQSLLEGENGEIVKWKKAIQDCLDDIEDYQKEIDAGQVSDLGSPSDIPANWPCLRM